MNTAIIKPVYKSCKDCKHFKVNGHYFENGKCALSKHPKQEYYGYASVHRLTDCGLIAKYFEPVVVSENNTK